MINPPLRLIDFKLRVYTTLNQSRAIVLSKPHKSSDLCHVFPCHRSWSPSASRSYVVVANPTAVFCTNRLALIHETVQSDPAELVRLHDMHEAPKSCSANLHPSHDNSILAYMTSCNALKHPCCANKSFNLVCHNPKLLVSSNFSTSNLVSVGAMILCTADP